MEVTEEKLQTEKKGTGFASQMLAKPNILKSKLKKILYQIPNNH